MDFQFGILVVGKHGESCVTGAGADFKQYLGTGILLGYFSKDGELLSEPLAVLEKVRGVILVEKIPPLGWIAIEPSCNPESAF
jgi:hypothetical protein